MVMPILTSRPTAAIARNHGLGGSAANQYEPVIAATAITITMYLGLMAAQFSPAFPRRIVVATLVAFSSQARLQHVRRRDATVKNALAKRFLSGAYWCRVSVQVK